MQLAQLIMVVIILQDNEFEYPLEEDEHPLSYYSVDDDDVIHVIQ